MAWRPEDAPGLVLGEGVELGDGVTVGSGVTIHDGVVLGDGCVLEDNVVLGKVPKLARRSSARGAEPGPLRIGARTTICTGAVVFAGSEIGAEAILGDQSYVRERVRVGDQTVIGRGSCLDNDVVVGDRVSIQTMVYITAFSLIEDDVFVGPGASTTNDDTMSRHDRAYALRGVTLRRACRVGGSTVFVPGVEVGEEAFVAAGAVVTRDVPRRGVALGVPARVIREVGEGDLLERWR